MKKIIAISVMFALIAGAVFADTSLSGGLNVHFDLATDKDHGDGKNVGMGNFSGGGDFDASWEGENAGGKIRLKGEFGHAMGWWKPIDQLKIQLGAWDGEFGHGTIYGWGFTAGAKDVPAIETKFAGDSPVGNFGGTGWNVPILGFSIYPADGFEINIGIPLNIKTKTSTGAFEWVASDKPASPPTGLTNTDTSPVWKPQAVQKETIAPLAVILQNTKLNVKADIPDVGTVKVALDLQKAGKDVGIDGAPEPDLYTNVFLNFYVSAIENMGIELSAGLTSSKPKKNDLIDLTLGYQVDAGDFNLKAAFGFGVAGHKILTKSYIPFSAQILPSYNLGSLTAFLNVGLATNIGIENATVGIVLNPYIQVPISTGNFWAGFKFATTSAAGAKAEWSIPVGFTFGF